jgi:lipopolysaccharide transport system ATP-binding protein
VGTGFHHELTGRENILLNGALLGMGREEIKRKFDEIVDFSGIEKFIDTPVKRYSSGMYVRLAFAVAAHLDPEILLVDEVLAVGDAGFQQKCLGKMDDVAKRGRTVLFVSHNMGAISSLCSRAILLVDGEKFSDDTATNIVSQYMESISDTTGSSYLCREEPDSRAWIVSANLKSAAGKDCGTFLMTEPIFVDCVLNISANSKLTLSVQIKEMDNAPIYHFPNGDSSFVIPSSPGRHRIRVRIPPLNLYPGKYRMRLALTDTVNKTQEEIEKINFVIQQDYALCPRPLPRQAGLIFSIPKWSAS